MTLGVMDFLDDATAVCLQCGATEALSPAQADDGATFLLCVRCQNDPLWRPAGTRMLAVPQRPPL
jgi:hypothetical protein